MKKVSYIFIVILFTVNMGCDNDENPKATPDGGPSIEFTFKSDNYIFFADHEKFQEASARRANDTYCSVKSDIKKVQREGNLLGVSLMKPKGCEVSYEVIWNGLILESFPVQITLFLKTIGSCGDTEEKEADEVVLDLEEIFKDVEMVNPDEAVFMVKDACSLLDIQCDGDCDITVSDN